MKEVHGSIERECNSLVCKGKKRRFDGRIEGDIVVYTCTYCNSRDW